MEELAKLFEEQFNKLQNELLEAGLNDDQAFKIAIAATVETAKRNKKKGKTQ